MNLTENIKQKAKELGFSKIGTTDTSPLSRESENRYYEWLGEGYNAEMDYLERDVEKRLNPLRIFEGAKSIISLAINYSPGWIEQSKDKNLAFISRYALGYDYHKVVFAKLKLLFDFIVKETKGKAKGKIYCDTGPLLEKAIAERAGLGWIGKNGLLITKEFGSWVFLGEIILDVELRKDTQAKNLCSDCNLCIKSCPSGAIIAPGIIDASRCFSYLTIENRKKIPFKLRNVLGSRVFGCDACQEVCPFNNNVPETEEPLFEPQKELLSMPLEKFFILANKQFKEYFKNSTIKRVKRNGLLRNITVAMGNSGNKEFLLLLKKASKESDSIIRKHAEWAICKIGGNRFANLVGR